MSEFVQQVPVELSTAGGEKLAQAIRYLEEKAITVKDEPSGNVIFPNKVKLSPNLLYIAQGIGILKTFLQNHRDFAANSGEEFKLPSERDRYPADSELPGYIREDELFSLDYTILLEDLRKSHRSNVAALKRFRVNNETHYKIPESHIDRLRSLIVNRADNAFAQSHQIQGNGIQIEDECIWNNCREGYDIALKLLGLDVIRDKNTKRESIINGTAIRLNQISAFISGGLPAEGYIQSRYRLLTELAGTTDY